MQNFLGHYIMLAKRWAWIIILGVIICGGVTYVVSKFMRPVYQASTVVVVNFNSASPYENTNAALVALPTYAQLVRISDVLLPVVAKHHGLTLPQLSAMISVKPQSNTQLIEIDVNNSNPKLAMQLANEVAQSFSQYATTQQSASVSLVSSAQFPVDPVGPKPSQNALIGALVGLGLAITLVVIFEWIDDRPASLEEVQELLGMDPLAVIPMLSRKQRAQNPERIPALAEGCRMLYTGLNAAQAAKPFKLVMVTSAVDGEGKSTIAANLATFLAMAGKRVLLVDADLRRPVQYRHFHLDSSKGLSRILQETSIPIMMASNIQATDIPTLHILTAGAPSAHSVELFQSSRANQLFEYFKKAPYDYILFDTPPLLPVADAQLLTTYIHAAVLIVDASKTPRKVLLRAKNALKRTQARLLGVAINKSTWPEYGYIRQYQRDLLLSSSDQMMLPPPGTTTIDSISEMLIPTTPPIEEDIEVTNPAQQPLDKIDTMQLPPHAIDELVDPNMTMTFPHPKYPKHKNEEQKTSKDKEEKTDKKD